MITKVSFIYAYRNRDVGRVRISLESLKQQSESDFEVIFVDYGSEPEYSIPIKELLEKIDFATYHYVGHSGLLWNKSKALNFGIAISETPYVFIADVDVVFENNFLKKSLTKASEDSFLLYYIGYLDPKVTIDLKKLNALNPRLTDRTFGVGLFPAEALKAVGGLDPFFHFYGSEDEDLNARLKFYGLTEVFMKDCEMWHIWHKRFPDNDKNKLTKVPKLTNIRRLNQQHFLTAKANEVVRHKDAHLWNSQVFASELQIFNEIDVERTIPNIKAMIDHFLNVELPTYQNKVVSLKVIEDQEIHSIKYKVKKHLKGISQPRASLKFINDRILEHIIFRYRHYNYVYKVDILNKCLIFSINLKSPLK